MSSNHNAPMRKHSFLSTWHSDCTVSNPSEGNILRYIGGKWVAINFADALVYKGVIDCSSNPNYPAADSGHVYKVSVAGRIGGASGEFVDVGDMMICNTDGTPSGDEATVGDKWNILQANIDSGEIIMASSGNITAAMMNGGIINTNGQVNDIVFSLDAAFEGAYFTIIVGTAVAKYVRVDPNALDSIYKDGATGGDGKYVGVASAVVGYEIFFKAFKTGASTYDWNVSYIGPWLSE